MGLILTAGFNRLEEDMNFGHYFFQALQPGNRSQFWLVSDFRKEGEASLIVEQYVRELNRLTDH